jgi:hypothetical protein
VTGVIAGPDGLVGTNERFNIGSISVVLGVPVQTRVTLEITLGLKRDILPIFRGAPTNLSSANKCLLVVVNGRGDKLNGFYFGSPI